MMSDELGAVIGASAVQALGVPSLQFLALIILSALGAFLGAYLKEKAKSVATKEDIAEITSRIENVKRSIDAIRTVDITRYQLKYDACLEALRLIDAFFSHKIEGREIVKQFASTEEARSCHSRLVLACESTELIEQFMRIMFWPRTEEDKMVAPTELLNSFRNLVRKELGFGTEPLELDKDVVWFGKIISEKT